MFTLAAQVAAPVVGNDAAHRDCTCAGIVVALPDGTLHLFAEQIEALEALGWGILAAAEEMKRARPEAHERQEAHQHV